MGAVNNEAYVHAKPDDQEDYHPGDDEQRQQRLKETKDWVSE